MVLSPDFSTTNGRVCFVFASVTTPLTLVSWANDVIDEKRKDIRRNSLKIIFLKFIYLCNYPNTNPGFHEIVWRIGIDTTYVNNRLGD
jgi:hypothetical protein